MSHFTTVKTEIRDAEALKSACAELGFGFMENARARGFNGRTLKGDYVLRLKGPYDIAVSRTAGGAMALACDWWDGHVENEAGPGYGRLLQIYGVHKTAAEARRKGYTVRRRALADGSVKLVIGGRR